MEEMTLEQANKIINKVTDDGLEKIASYLHYIIYNSDDKQIQVLLEHYTGKDVDYRDTQVKDLDNIGKMVCILNWLKDKPETFKENVIRVASNDDFVAELYRRMNNQEVLMTVDFKSKEAFEEWR